MEEFRPEIVADSFDGTRYPFPMEGGKKIWFPAKRYGWGWGPPVCWQGWLVLGLWTAMVAVGAIWLRENLSAYFLFMAIEIIALIAICWWKGETPKWRWGGK